MNILCHFIAVLLAIVMTVFTALFGHQLLVIGKQLPVNIQASSVSISKSRKVSTLSNGWDITAGAYRPKDIVAEVSLLLDAVCVQLDGAGEISSTRKLLIDGLARCLAISGRESTLPLASLNFADAGRREIASQARTIGEGLVKLVREHGVPTETDSLRNVVLRSNCDGHLWTPQAAQLLMGAHGGPNVMQLYNEWLHQLVLLRDSLLPFVNWDEVVIEKPASSRGLRWTESSRSRLTGELMSRKISHSTIVQHAFSVLQPESTAPKGTYGLQYKQGVILPTVLLSPESTSKYLLSYAPLQLVSGNVAFVPQFDDYFAAPRSQVGKGVCATKWPVTSSLDLAEAAIVPANTKDTTSELQLKVSNKEGVTAQIDVGQILRGHRYSYGVNGPTGTITDLKNESIVIHEPFDILTQEGLVTDKSGVHVIKTGGHGLVQLALLGKLYPENVVFQGDASWESIQTTGKGFGTKFILA